MSNQTQRATPATSLADQAAAINAEWQRADADLISYTSRLVGIGRMLSEMRGDFDAAPPTDVTWRQWCDENFTERSYDNIRTLIREARSPDPVAAHARANEAAKERMAALRARDRIEAAEAAQDITEAGERAIALMPPLIEAGERSPIPANDDAARLGHYWVTPPDIMANIIREFGPVYDPCPHPRPASYDGLTTEWGPVNYVNPVWGPGFTAWVHKSRAETAKGKTCIIMVPIYLNRTIAGLVEVGADIRFLGSPAFLSLENGTPNPLPIRDRNPCVLAVLRPMSVRVQQHVPELCPACGLARVH